MLKLKFNFYKVLKHESNMRRQFSSAATANEILFREVKNKLKIGVVTLNRPKALNSFTLSMSRQIEPKLRKWESEMSFVIVKGSGDKAFSAGADIREMVDGIKRNDANSLDHIRIEYTRDYLVANYKIPYVALIHGITMGAGAGFSILGKYRVATEKTIFAMPENGIGLYPDSGASYFLSRLPDHYGVFMGLTGCRVIGLDVLKSGLATHYCDFNKIPSLEQELLNVSSVTEIPQVLNKYTQESLKGKDRNFSLQDKNINQHFSAESVEAIIQNLKNENSDWSNKQRETLMKLSPTSLKTSLYILKHGKNWSLKECLKMDYRAIGRMIFEKDFAEGVRATIVDKDNNPKWDPATLEEVDETKVLSFFKPFPPDKELKL